MARTLVRDTSLALMLLGTAVVLLPPDYAEARGGRGGGVSRAGPSSISRGGGGGYGGGRGSYGGGGRSSVSSSRGSYGGAASRPSAGSRDIGGGSRASAGTRDAGRTQTANRTGDRTTNRVNGGDRTNRVNTGDRGGNRVNNGDVNIGSNNNINVDVDNGWGGIYDHPIAAGAVIGTTMAVTAAAIGSMYYSLPPGCAPRPYGAYSYYYCGSTWYAPQYQGDQVTYVVVEEPK